MDWVGFVFWTGLGFGCGLGLVGVRVWVGYGRVGILLGFGWGWVCGWIEDRVCFGFGLRIWLGWCGVWLSK